MMKWWGWGHPDFTFPMDQKPDLWPFISKMAGLNLTPDTNKTLPVLEENIQLHAPEINQDFLCSGIYFGISRNFQLFPWKPIKLKLFKKILNLK